MHPNQSFLLNHGHEWSIGLYFTMHHVVFTVDENKIPANHIILKKKKKKKKIHLHGQMKALVFKNGSSMSVIDLNHKALKQTK